jgi:polar amino acid transport system permease protein
VTESFDFVPALLRGLGVTLWIYAAALPIAACTGLLAGLLQQYGGMLAHAARAYVWILRGSSALVLLFWIYFCLPLFGFYLSAEAAGSLALGLNIGAYGAEVVRSGLRSVPRSQWDAAQVLGFTRSMTVRRVVLPQAFAVMLPGLGNLAVELLKSTSLVSLITLTDLSFQALLVRDQTLRTTEVFVVTLLFYWAVSILIGEATARLEARFTVHRGVHR